MKYKKRLQGIFIACSVAVGGVAFAATPSANMLGNTCAGCHGTNGNSSGPATPTIAGISSEYFIETMQAYKSGERPSTIMTRIAKGYTDEEIKLMADFFSKIKFDRSKSQTVDAKLAKKGMQLHDKYCEKCHEDGGRSTADDAGILAGQWKPYLKYTLEDFTSGNREMEKKMKKKLEQLQKSKGDAGIEQLLHYYASQQ
jgi:sulfide dehydrogenase cytochrome subunit